MRRLKRVKLDKKDIYRPLLSDTLTGDNLLVYSNDGFYLNAHRNKDSSGTEFNLINSLFENIILPENTERKIPFKYKIKKNIKSSRCLSLVHPSSQIDYCIFYSQYSDLILHYCSLSKASIRSPHKVSNSYFSKEMDQSTKYKDLSIETLEVELGRKYPSSYFSYRGFNRLYKFFENENFINLEREFGSLTFADISNCFGSIYTHSICWALKSKDYAKSAIRNLQFCNSFDKVMQESNNGETNGIPVGAEFSRVFAELILQKNDVDIISFLKTKHSLDFGKNYVFYRYVDDYMIFTNKSTDLDLILACISNHIGEYNLNINENKIKHIERPFSTEKGMLSASLINDIDTYFRAIVEDLIDDSGKRTLHINLPKNSDLFKKRFIDVVKAKCYSLGGDYNSVSSLIISSISNRVIRVIEDVSRLEPDSRDTKAANLIVLLLDICFFFFSVSKEIKPSEKLSKVIVLADRYFTVNNKSFLNFYRTFVFDRVSSLPLEEYNDTLNKTRHLPIEYLNIILAISNFGNPFTIDEKILDGYFESLDNPSYFEIVFFIYYCRENNKYEPLRKKVESLILEKLINITQVKYRSEEAHIFLDSLSCPFISFESRSLILRKYLEAYETDIDTSNFDYQTYLSIAEQQYWFVKWRGLDLIKLIERKALLGKY